MNKRSKSLQVHSAATAREAAFLALLASLKEECFIADSLDHWHQIAKPSSPNLHLARQIAYGTAQMALALDYLAEQLSEKGRLSLKLKERVLLRQAIYQAFFLERIPIYAIADETVKLARKYCHQSFVGYLNAILRKISQASPKLPAGNSISDLSIRYSYPEYFVQRLRQHYGLEKAMEILESGNIPAPTMMRVRSKSAILPSSTQLVCETPCTVARLNDPTQLETVTTSSLYYIQNVTPAVLISELCKNCVSPPRRILDLCASPGGKLIAVHDAFPKASLFGNDVSEEKLRTLRENCQKYHVDATLSCGQGEDFTSSTPFDLIILDVLCSNSGVLNKRPEARWRLTSENQRALEKMQLRLIENAVKLLAPHGEIWYMTCSILPEENEKIVARATQLYGLQTRFQKLILPNHEGWDGGFACAMRTDAT